MDVWIVSDPTNPNQAMSAHVSIEHVRESYQGADWIEHADGWWVGRQPGMRRVFTAERYDLQGAPEAAAPEPQPEPEMPLPRIFITDSVQPDSERPYFLMVRVGDGYQCFGRFSEFDQAHAARKGLAAQWGILRSA